MHHSRVSKMVEHPAYQRIMGMGEAVVPLLLETLRHRPGHWFRALMDLAKIDSVPKGATLAGAREAWLEWGRKEGPVD